VGQTYDFAQLLQQAATARYELLPDGEYNVAVVDSSLGSTSNGKDMIKVKMSITDGPHTGRFIWTQFVMSPENDQALGFFFRNLECFGIDRAWILSVGNGTLDPIVAALSGRTTRVVLGHKNLNGEERNEVKNFKPQVGGVPSAAPAGLPGGLPSPVSMPGQPVPSAAPPGWPQGLPQPAAAAAPAVTPPPPPPPPAPIPAPAPPPPPVAPPAPPAPVPAPPPVPVPPPPAPVEVPPPPAPLAPAPATPAPAAPAAPAAPPGWRFDPTTNQWVQDTQTPPAQVPAPASAPVAPPAPGQAPPLPF
jgi:hypothetical protein